MGPSAESHTGTTGSTNQGSFTFTFDGGASPQGVALCAFTSDSTTQNVTAIDVGGSAASVVSGGVAASDGTPPGAGGEDGVTTVWFLSNPPTGSQTYTVTRTNTANTVYIGVIAFDAATTHTEVYSAGITLTQTTSGTIAEATADDGSPGTASVRIGCGWTSADAPDDPGANSGNATAVIDLGGQTMKMVAEMVAGQGSRPIGFADITSAGRAAVYFAVREVAAAGGVAGERLLKGVGK